jgi:hypothetical protein
VGIDLLGKHGDARFSPAAWRECLDLASAFGWRPETPVASLYYNDSQEVTDGDARALALTLRRAVSALRMGQSLSDEQAKAFDKLKEGFDKYDPFEDVPFCQDRPPSSEKLLDAVEQIVRRVAEYALLGGFTIA